MCPLVVCTKAHKGVTAIKGTQRVDAGVHKILPIDTTGAGDQFAAGFLYGMTHDMNALDSGRIGAAMAAGVISQTGPRYLGNAKKLIKEKLGIIL